MIEAILRNLAQAAGPAVAAFFIFACSALVGAAAIPRKIRPAHARVRVLADISVGTAILGWTTWVAGALLGTSAVLPVAGVLVLLSLRRLPDLGKGTRRLVGELTALSRRGWGPVLVLGTLLTLTIPDLLLPPASTDAIRYHLALPKLFLLTGKVFYYPYDVTGAFPQLAEMLNLLGLKLAGGETARFLHWGFFVLTLVALVVLVHRGRRFRDAATLAPVFYAVSPVAVAIAADAFIDHTAVFHIAVGLLLATTGGSPLLVGAVLGAALATKYTAAPAVAAIVIAAVLRTRRRRRLRATALLAIPIAVAFLPFAVRNILATGDPIYPIGNGLFGDSIAGVSPASLAAAKNYHGSVPGLLGITWDLRQGPAQADEVAGMHHILGFLALGLVLTLPVARVLAAPVVASLALGLVLHPPTRYLLPMFFCLSGLEALALGSFVRRRAHAWLALLLTVPALALSANLLVWAFRPLDVLVGARSRSEFLAAYVPSWRAAQAANALPAGGRIMALDFPAPYYLDRPWIAEGMLNEPPLKAWITQAEDGAQVLDRLRAADVRYLLVTPGYGGGTRASLFPLASTAQAQRTVLELRLALRYVRTVDGVDIYAVPPGRPPREGVSPPTS